MIVYIDGFNLYYGLKAKNWQRFYWLDLECLAAKLTRSGQKLELVRYFTARIRTRGSAQSSVKRQNTYLEALDTLQKLRVQFGHFLAKQVTCRNCGLSRETYEEKMSDVNIAVALLNDAFDGRFDTAVIVSGDSDLAGPISAVKRRYQNKRLIVAFPPGRSSAHLRKVADGHFAIGRSTLSSCQLPDPVIKPDGFALKRPSSWR